MNVKINLEQLHIHFTYAELVQEYCRLINEYGNQEFIKQRYQRIKNIFFKDEPNLPEIISKKIISIEVPNWDLM